MFAFKVILVSNNNDVMTHTVRLLSRWTLTGLLPIFVLSYCNKDEDDKPVNPNPTTDAGMVTTESVDADQDGFDSTVDPDDTDPCVPDEMAPVCNPVVIEDAGTIDEAGDVVPTEYYGSYETGVVCGERQEVCDINDTCCVYANLDRPEGRLEVNTFGECASFGCNEFAHFFTADVQCDGQQDCQERYCPDNVTCESAPVCCASLPGLRGTQSRCRPDFCTESEFKVCIASEECAADSLCCSVKVTLAGVNELPLDIGACFPTDDCAKVQITPNGVQYLE